MWTVEFFAEQETIGTVVASFDGAPVYKGSVNLSDQDSVDDFVASAKKAHEQVKPDPVATLLQSLTDALNK
jgi:hypothetical protein